MPDYGILTSPLELAMSSNEKPTAICAQCKANFDRGASKSFPFCSPRCKLLDLGAWASERYVIQGKPLEDTAAELSSDEIDEQSNDA